MKPLYLTGREQRLVLRSNRLVHLDNDNGTRQEWEARDLPFDAVISECFGGFISIPALRWLALNGVSLTLLNFNGRPLSVTMPDFPLNAPDRLLQLQAHLDPGTRALVAREILARKVGTSPPAWAKTVPELMEWEARRAAEYWDALGIVRDYPNARDPLNAVLNYAYGILESRARLAVHRSGMDPAVGFLHTPQNYKSAFVYDVMEPFRAKTDKAVLPLARAVRRTEWFTMYGYGVRLRPQLAERVVSAVSRAFADKDADSFVHSLPRTFAFAYDSSPGNLRVSSMVSPS